MSTDLTTCQPSGVPAQPDELAKTELRATDIRRCCAAHRERQPCFVCGRHGLITEAHHVVPLKRLLLYVNILNAQLATLTSDLNGLTQHFTAEFAIYSNVKADTLEGTRWGTLYVIVPSLKLGVDGAAIDGDQSSNTTTGIVGQAMMYDDTVVVNDCSACGGSASPLAYYLVVPCDTTSGVSGLALVGGVLSVPVSSSHTLNEFKLVMANGSLVAPDPAFMSYALTGAPEGTSVSGNVLTAGETAGDGEIKGTYTDGGVTYDCVANLSVVSAG